VQAALPVQTRRGGGGHTPDLSQYDNSVWLHLLLLVVDSFCLGYNTSSIACRGPLSQCSAQAKHPTQHATLTAIPAEQLKVHQQPCCAVLWRSSTQDLASWLVHMCRRLRVHSCLSYLPSPSCPSGHHGAAGLLHSGSESCPPPSRVSPASAQGQIREPQPPPPPPPHAPRASPALISLLTSRVRPPWA
jgi:hypothetical protein